MPQSFFKAAACSPDLRVADCAYNAERMSERIREAGRLGVRLLVFPELSVTGAGCGDLFFQKTLIDGAWQSILYLARQTAGLGMIVVAGLPAARDGRLHNCAAVLHGGHIAGLIAKSHLPAGQSRWFSPAAAPHGAPGDSLWLDGGAAFVSPQYPDLALGVAVLGDLADAPPQAWPQEASLVAALAASGEGAGASGLRRAAARAHTAQGLCALVYASAGPDESTTDTVCGGHRLAAECGDMLAETPPFGPDTLTVTDIDLGRLAFARRRARMPASAGPRVSLALDPPAEKPALSRTLSPLPFIHETGLDAPGQWAHILDIQAHGLKKRLAHTGCQTAVIGVSGGLDSTLALLVIDRAFSLMGLDKSGILAYSLPCFGTTELTKSNAYNLCRALDIDLSAINIAPAVRQHFADIGQREGVHDAAYENAQARERTQVLMDIANQRGGLLVGTGDLSELALGWATYNGDHMSMYGVNGGVPKTVIRHMLAHLAQQTQNAALAAVLQSILDTPVSPELLPAQDGQIAQKTEDLVGPYDLHDFFIFHALGRGSGPHKLHHMACHAFAGRYSSPVIARWMNVFFSRFFSQQFKRSCMPDGPDVGLLSLSPRGGLAMPSDASRALWQRELESLSAR